MRRREVISALGFGVSSALAGCTGDEVASDIPAADNRSDENFSAQDEETPARRWEGVETVPVDELREPDMTRVVRFEQTDLSASVGTHWLGELGGIRTRIAMSAPATSTSPAQVLSLIWNSGSTIRWIPAAFTGVLSEVAGASDRGDQAYLVPTASHPAAIATPSVWKDESDRWRLETLGRWYPDRLRLLPGEGFLGEQYLVAPPDTTFQPLRTGRYSFGMGQSRFDIALWETTHPGPRGLSQHVGRSVPPLPDVSRVGWYHQANAGTEIFLEPDQEVTTLPAEITLSIINRSSEPIESTMPGWGFLKLENGRWYHLAPWLHFGNLVTVYPGDRLQDRLSLTHELDPDRRSVGFGHLGGGIYAYRSGFGREGHVFAALFSLQAPPVEPQLDPNSTVSVSEGIARVELPQLTERSPVVAVERITSEESADVAVIAEQLSGRGFPRASHGIALLEDDTIDRVEIHGDIAQDHGSVDIGATPTIVEYRSMQYRFEPVIDQQEA